MDKARLRDLTRKFKTLFKRARFQSGVASESRRTEIQSALDFVERKGLRVSYYLPTIDCHDDADLCRAVETLRLSGYIMTKEDGSLFGKIARVNLSSEEIAQQRRKKFKAI